MMKPNPALTQEEQQLIEKYLRFYDELAEGVRRPMTRLQRRFVSVAHGERNPETPHEIAYLKYLRLKAHERREASSPAWGDDEPHKTANWFSDEDWKKLRRQEWGAWKARQRGG